tara:strand:+ start:209 stop:556 length:348 start_codon:yes stop_codon:yes gene_type:complete
MIGRILENSKIIIISLPFNNREQDLFIEKNPTGGFIKIDTLPEQLEGGSNYKWLNGEVVVDEEENNLYASQEYARTRKAKYDLLNQDEMRFDDQVNSTTTWVDAINAIKDAHPKP